MTEPFFFFPARSCLGLTLTFPQPAEAFVLSAVPPPLPTRRRERVPAPPRVSGGSASEGRKKSKREEDRGDSEHDNSDYAADESASTRERVIRWEADRERAEMAGQAAPAVKEKTGYQLFHMHRVAEIKGKSEAGSKAKGDSGVKHHEAFKRAAKDWSRLPESEKEWYNNRADKKPVAKAAKQVGYDDINALRVVDQAVSEMLHEVYVHSAADAFVAPPELPPCNAAVAAAAAAASNSNDQSPPGLLCRNSTDFWPCTVCATADAGAPESVCLMCAAFGNADLGQPSFSTF